MKFKDIFNITIKNTLRSKESYLIQILLLVVSIATLFSLSYKSSFDKYWDKYIYKNPEFRIMNINYNDLLEKRVATYDETLSFEEKMKSISNTIDKVNNILSSNKHILGFSTAYRSFFYIDGEKNIDREFSINGVPLVNNIEIDNGNNLDKYNKTDKVMICPNIMIAEKDNNTFDSSKTMDISYLLDKDIDIKIGGVISDKYKIVGFYDTYSSYALGFDCYTSYNNIEYMNKKLSDYGSPDSGSEDYRKSPYYTGDTIYIMIDNMKNINNVTNFLRDNRLYTSGPVVYINTETVNNISSICMKVTIAVLLLLSIITVAILMQKIDKKKEEIFTYKALGYKNKDIIKLIFSENILLIILGYLLSIPITMLGLNIYKEMILRYNSRMYLLNPSIDIKNLVITLFMLVSIPIIISIITIVFTKIKKDKNYV
jgi:ABC-type antimicrobial peptide transport system permease subunit